MANVIDIFSKSLINENNITEDEKNMLIDRIITMARHYPDSEEDNKLRKIYNEMYYHFLSIVLNGNFVSCNPVDAYNLPNNDLVEYAQELIMLRRYFNNLIIENFNLK